MFQPRVLLMHSVQVFFLFTSLPNIFNILCFLHTLISFYQLLRKLIMMVWRFILMLCFCFLHRKWFFFSLFPFFPLANVSNAYVSYALGPMYFFGVVLELGIWPANSYGSSTWHNRLFLTLAKLICTHEHAYHVLGSRWFFVCALSCITDMHAFRSV